MAKYKQGYNAKGRAGSLKKQQELKAAKQKTWVKNPDAEQPEDSNAELMVPKSEAEKEERKRKLKEELTPTETKISSKKRKRLDKYIDKQLKREEKKALFSEFAARKGTFDTSQLKSIKHMGDKETKKSRIEEALRLEKLGLGTDETKEILYEKHEQKEWDDEKHSHLLTDLERKEKEMAEEEEQENKSSFIDMRPKGGSGFGFQNLAKVSKPSKNSYSWRKKLEIEKARKNKKDYVSSGEDDTDTDDSDEDEDEDSDEDEDESDEEEGVTKKAKVAVEEDIEVDEEEEEEEEEEEDEDDEEDEESEEEEESEDEDTEIVTKKSKGSAFKEWIDEQTGPKSSNIDDLSHIKIKKERVERSEDRLTPPPEDIAQPEYAERKAFYVNVERDPEIQTSRMQLPVTGEEQRIMEAIFNNDCVIICGETGSGKTTQTPQFLIEAGFGTKGSGYPGMIGVTQPRRVAAISMAKRVANELGSEGHRVAHQVRFDVTVKDDTALKFMTDGVLLRELSQDFALTKYSALVIDEAHERNINTDILIGVLSRVLKLRKEMFNEGKCDSPLKLIIMSATLRVSDFTENKTLFPVPPPVLKVEARQYPVSVHFNKRTTYDYMDEIYRKTCKIHKRLPEGGILIFLTGQNEIVNVVKRLRKAFPDRSKVWKPKDKSEDLQVKVSANETVVEAEEVDFGADMRHQDYAAVEGESDTDEEDGEEGFEEELAVEERNESAPLHVLPLYSLLPTKEQMKVFEEVPEGHRLCVVATNVAETSLTIPGIRYVVDCGRAKERKYDEETGVQSFEVDFISKASADQRAGRAGRTGPGHCYRVFSSAVYEEFFPQFSIPEILRCPVEGIVLEMKHMGIDKVVNFPFPTPPDRQSLAKAEKLLEYLGALSPAGVISDMGKQMSLFPLSPRFAKMLIIGSQLDCLPYMVAIVAALTVGDPFIGEHELGINEQPAKVKAATHDEDGDRIKANESDSEPEDIYEIERKRKLRSTYHKSQAKLASLDPASDALKLLSAVCAMDYDSDLENFCKGFFLRHKLMEEMRKLRQQLSRIVVANSDARAAPALKDQLAAKLKPPSKLQIKALKQMIATGFVDQVAQRLDKVDEEYKLTSRERIINVPYQTLFPTSTSNKKTDDQGNPLPDDSQVFIHPGSVINAMGTHPPEMLVFASVNRSGSSKLRMKPLCDITPAQIGNISKGTALMTYSKPLPPPYGPKMLTSASRECWVVPRLGAAIGSGGTGWDLPPIKVKQEKKGSQWVTL